MGVRSGVIGLALLALANAPAGAEIHKCRQGARLIYQEAPCPADSQALPPPPIAPQPSAYAAEEARIRARDDIAAAAALKQRERKEAETRDKQAEAEARKQASDCDRMRDRIERAAAKVKPGKQPKTALKKDRRAYQETCGAL
jgi:hypothetical protein